MIRTKYVSEETVAAVFQLMEEAGKKPVLVKKDVPGFLANRMQHALFREAISIVENGIAEAGDVDDAIKYGWTSPTPFTSTYFPTLRAPPSPPS